MMVRNNEYVVSKVRGAAAERRVSQADLAEVLNLSRMAISRRFTGKSVFAPEELVAIADHLNVPVATFFGEVASYARAA